MTWPSRGNAGFEVNKKRALEAVPYFLGVYMKRNLVAGKSVAREAASTNLTPIATAVGIMILCAASASQAQEAAKPAAKAADAADTTVVVTGVRAALAQSLNQK